MDANLILNGLIEANIAAGVAILILLVIRTPVRVIFGAGASYALWLVPLLAAAGTLLPAMVIEADMTAAIPVPEIIGPGGVVEPMRAAPGASSVTKSAQFWPTTMLAIWLFGAVLMAVRLAFKHVSAMRALGVLTKDEAGALRTQNPVAGPAVVGVFRQSIVLPADFEARYDEAEQKAVLAHEHAHLKDRHVAAKALAQALACINWFNPMVHIAAWIMAEDQELTCDEAVIAAEPECRKAYARALLKTQTACVLPLGCAWPACSAKLLKRRIGAVCGGARSKTLRIAGLSVAGLVAAGLGAVAWAAQPPVLVDFQDTRAEVVVLGSGYTPPGVTSIPRKEDDIAAGQRGGHARRVVAAGGTATEAAQAVRAAYKNFGWDVDMLPKAGTERFASFQDGEFGIAGTANDGRTVIINDGSFDEYPGTPQMAAARTVKVLRSGEPKSPLLARVAQARSIGIPEEKSVAVPAPPLPTEPERLAAFTANDRDHDGRLDRSEYMGVLMTLNYTDQFATNWRQRDANRDNFISAEEYRLPLASAASASAPANGVAGLLGARTATVRQDRRLGDG